MTTMTNTGHEIDTGLQRCGDAKTSQVTQAADSIELTLDGRAHRVPANTTLAELVSQLRYAPTEVGTAVNGSFVARGERAGRTLVRGDAVLLFQPIVGG